MEIMEIIKNVPIELWVIIAIVLIILGVFTSIKMSINKNTQTGKINLVQNIEKADQVIGFQENNYSDKR